MSKQVYNFCAGPAMLPQDVMREAQREFCDFNQLGVSVMELSHRGSHYMKVAEQAEQDLRELMNIPSHYRVFFMHGGGRGQFSAVPLNLLTRGDAADYLLTGHWSKGAADEADKYADVSRIQGLETDSDGHTRVTEKLRIRAEARYLHYCPNETIEGVELFELPDSQGKPLIADMSSMLLSRSLDVSRFGLIYAGAQKNIGPAGLAIVIADPALFVDARDDIPAILDYRQMEKHGSMYNTPPTFAWYLAGKVFQWLKRQGGVAAIEEHNKAKADYLYQYIDSSDFYRNTVAVSYRSRMNVPFQLPDRALDPEFLRGAEQRGLLALKGHRAVGGMRASIYNAMPLEGVKALVGYMELFEKLQRR
ncbi:3-phosphoserine/phosphohydroxythreonine transaminase [Dongshaea marina]|uniref:3-phosphoserine/phosphohydroxythreonine transaminase n=1 Tax=Dongshaea marina TaxID=2047966 RepID=UPI000D3E85E2|nr:3-phosphoserine/phosphohydroxythreonine transaminase [Dongshaea marina]